MRGRQTSAHHAVALRLVERVRRPDGATVPLRRVELLPPLLDPGIALWCAEPLQAGVAEVARLAAVGVELAAQVGRVELVERRALLRRDRLAVAAPRLALRRLERQRLEAAVPQMLPAAVHVARSDVRRRHAVPRAEVLLLLPHRGLL